MSLPPVVSVVIVSWNARDFLRECLESLYTRVALDPIEVFVIDNASTDGSPEFVEKSFPHARLIRNESNLGFSRANNIGIRLCTGRYICLVNSDVTILDDCFGKLVAFMDSNPHVGLAGPRMLDAQRKTGRSCRGFPTVWNMFCHALALDSLFPSFKPFGGYIMRFWNQESSRSVDILGGWFWIARRSALSEVGLLDESFFFYAEDMDWCRRFRNSGWQIAFVADATSVHYGGGSSKRAPLKYIIQQQRADLQYWKKHHSIAERSAYFCICIIYHAMRGSIHGLFCIRPSRKGDHASTALRHWRCLLWYLSGSR